MIIRKFTLESFDAQFKNNKRQVNEGLASINDEVEDYFPPGWQICSAEVGMFVEEIAYKSKRKTTSFGKELKQIRRAGACLAPLCWKSIENIRNSYSESYLPFNDGSWLGMVSIFAVLAFKHFNSNGKLLNKLQLSINQNILNGLEGAIDLASFI